MRSLATAVLASVSVCIWFPAGAGPFAPAVASGQAAAGSQAPDGPRIRRLAESALASPNDPLFVELLGRMGASAAAALPALDRIAADRKGFPTAVRSAADASAKAIRSEISARPAAERTAARLALGESSFRGGACRDLAKMGLAAEPALPMLRTLRDGDPVPGVAIAAGEAVKAIERVCEERRMFREALERTVAEVWETQDAAACAEAAVAHEKRLAVEEREARIAAARAAKAAKAKAADPGTGGGPSAKSDKAAGPQPAGKAATGAPPAAKSSSAADDIEREIAELEAQEAAEREKAAAAREKAAAEARRASAARDAAGEKAAGEGAVIDASAGWWKSGPLRVTVTSAELRPESAAEDPFSRRPITIPRCVVIRIEVRNVGPAPVTLPPPDARSPARPGASAPSPKLTDEKDEECKPLPAAVAAAVDGKDGLFGQGSTGVRLEPGGSVSETLRFAPPAKASAFLLLELPARPVGSDHPLRFRLPRGFLVERAK